MAGKYADVAKQFRPFAEISSPFREAVDAEKARVAERNPAALALTYDAIRREKVSLERQESALNIRLAAVEELMWIAYEDAGLESQGLQGGGLVSVTDDLAVSVADRAKLNAWARANGLESHMTLYAPTIESVTRQRILSGEEPPDGVVVGSRKKTTYRRGSVV